METPKPIAMQSPEAQAAREKVEHARTEKGRVEAQAIFERQMRIDAKNEGTESALYSHHAVQAREASDRELAHRAKQRNATRTLFQKLTGRGKVSGLDLLHEEADQVNELVDAKVARERTVISAQEAADEIMDSKEFEVLDSAAGLDRNEFREYLREQDPQIERSIEAGDLKPINALIGEMAGTEDGRMNSRFLESGRRMIAEKVDTMLKSGNTETLKLMLMHNDLRYVDRKTLASLPEEIRTAPGIAGKIQERLG
ncbi:MAG TPA: hypothetical protein VGB97_02060 [Candidatus Paceibacterota bacterium]